jgi:hypothetical protein
MLANCLHPAKNQIVIKIDEKGTLKATEQQI